jgi:excisionase family DNA binding protein
MNTGVTFEDVLRRIVREELVEALKGQADPVPAAPVKLAYSAQETAELLGISESGVRKMVSAGRLPRVPGVQRVLVPAKALERLMAGEAA